MDGLWTLYLPQATSIARPSRATMAASTLPQSPACPSLSSAISPAASLPTPTPAFPIGTAPLAQIRQWLPEFTALRRDLHAHPETGFGVHRTATLVAERLAAWGIEVHRNIGRTGLVGVLRNGDGPCVGLRADMDALDMAEENGFAHASAAPGRMHACGHDGHTAMLLAAARYLTETRRFRGTVHLIFQPAEEGHGGAQAMIADGLFERFPCDAVYALHNAPGMPIGRFGLATGAMMAGCGFFDIDIHGRGGHAGRPETTIDPVVCGAQLITALQSVVARNLPPREAGVVSVTGFEAGMAHNIIPERVTLRGTVRAFDRATMQLIEQRVRGLIQGVAAGFGATAELRLREAAAPLINAAGPAQRLADAAADLVGEAQVDRHLPASVVAEDFAYMLAERPGAYIFVGNGIGEAGGVELHSPRYDFNDDAIPYGAGALAAVAERELTRIG